MARITNSIMSKRVNEYAYGPSGDDALMTNIETGGQFGYMADPKSLIANGQMVRPDIIAVLLESPRGFNDLPDSERLHSILKSLVERHATEISGMVSTLSVEFVSAPSGNSLEEHDDVSRVTRAKSEPSFTWPDKPGRPIGKFLDYWILNLLEDPETTVPRVTTIPENADKDIVLSAEYRGMTVLFFEPDVTHTRVVHAWISTNMMPHTGGVMEGSRDKTAGKEAVVHSVPFTAYTTTGEAAKIVAQNYLDSMNLSGVNVNQRPAVVDAIVADVESATSGFKDQVDEAANEYISS